MNTSKPVYFQLIPSRDEARMLFDAEVLQLNSLQTQRLLQILENYENLKPNFRQEIHSSCFLKAHQNYFSLTIQSNYQNFDWLKIDKNQIRFWIETLKQSV